MPGGKLSLENTHKKERSFEVRFYIYVFKMTSATNVQILGILLVPLIFYTAYLTLLIANG
jgi:hypothetical protein